MAIPNNITMFHVEFVVNEMKKLVGRLGCGGVYYKSDIRYGVYVDETHCGSGGLISILGDMIEVYVGKHYFIFSALPQDDKDIIRLLTLAATNLGFDVHVFELPLSK